MALVKVSPSILSADFARLGEAVSLIDESNADYIHVDVMDGHFVPNITVGASVVKSIRKYSSKIFDVHLMLSEPSKYVDAFIDAGSNIISIHHEVKEDRFKLLNYIRSKGCRSSIVFNPDSPLNDIKSYFSFVDQILIMSVFPGFGGQSFIKESLDRGTFVRKALIEENCEHIDLEIDGGIKMDNCQEVVAAGYNVLVSGSGIFETEDSLAAIDYMKST